MNLKAWRISLKLFEAIHKFLTKIVGKLKGSTKFALAKSKSLNTCPDKSGAKGESLLKASIAQLARATDL